MMSKALARCAIVCWAMSVGGCQVGKLPSDSTLDPKSANGIVVVALTYSGRTEFTAFTVRLREVGSDSGEQTMHTPAMFVEHDIDEEGALGWIFPRELPPGEYEFFAWNAMSARMTHRSSVPFSTRFSVQAGRAAYIGNLHVAFAGSQYQVQVHDRRDRDVDLFLFRYPKFRKDQLDYRIMRSGVQGRRGVEMDDLKGLLPKSSPGNPQPAAPSGMDDLKDLLPPQR